MFDLGTAVMCWQIGSCNTSIVRKCVPEGDLTGKVVFWKKARGFRAICLVLALLHLSGLMAESWCC